MKIIEGDFATPKGRFAIVAGRFNGFVVEPLVAGARDALLRHGVKDDAIELIFTRGLYGVVPFQYTIFQGISGVGVPTVGK